MRAVKGLQSVGFCLRLCRALMLIIANIMVKRKLEFSFNLTTHYHRGKICIRETDTEHKMTIFQPFKYTLYIQVEHFSLHLHCLVCTEEQYERHDVT